eukprot:scaffold434_cov186-Pinguiococcus_pyrenoidosus.AAC.82
MHTLICALLHNARTRTRRSLSPRRPPEPKAEFRVQRGLFGGRNSGRNAEDGHSRCRARCRTGPPKPLASCGKTACNQPGERIVFGWCWKRGGFHACM